MIGDNTANADDEVWQLTLQLKDIVEIICAQIISLSQVTYLDIRAAMISQHNHLRQQRKFVNAKT